ncbi:MAG: serine hydrolase domain-containing protein [Maribacter sp.]
MIERTLEKKLKEIFHSKNPAPGFSILIEKNNCRVFDFSIGVHSKEKPQKVTSDTIYDLASITKIYTTAIILQLWQNKKIDIFSPCSKYMDTYRNSTLKIIDLLTQKANFDIRLSYYRENYPNDFHDVIFNLTPPNAVSQKVIYENITFLHLGKIIEIVTNKPLKDVFEEFFIEYNLSNTHLGLLDQTRFESPTTELINENIISSITHDESSRLLGGIAGNAGVFASANDLLKFGSLWINNQILSHDFSNEFVFKNYDISDKAPQALGWWMRMPNENNLPKNTYSHTGFTGCLLVVNSITKLVIVLVTNRTYYGRNNQNHKLIWNELIKFSKSL